MSEFYVLGIVQEASYTAAALSDRSGRIIGHAEVPVLPIRNEAGWISYDACSLVRSCREAAGQAAENAGISRERIGAVGLCVQHGTALAWDRMSGEPLAYAIARRCPRAGGVERGIREKRGQAQLVYAHTGNHLSAFLPAAKLSWLLQNNYAVQKAAGEGRLALGCLGEYLVYTFTHGQVFRTDTSTAGRSGLFHLEVQEWDPKVCQIFGIPLVSLPATFSSAASYGESDLEGLLKRPVPISCLISTPGTLSFSGTNPLGEEPILLADQDAAVLEYCGGKREPVRTLQTHILKSSAAGTEYILEQEIPEAGSLLTWLRFALGEPGRLKVAAMQTGQNRRSDKTFLLPAAATARDGETRLAPGLTICRAGQRTGREELMQAGCESVAFLLERGLHAFEQERGIHPDTIRVDGSLAENETVMQLLSSLTQSRVKAGSAKTRQNSLLRGLLWQTGVSAGLYTGKEEEFGAEKERSGAGKESFGAGKESSDPGKEPCGWKEYIPGRISDELLEKREAWQKALEERRC